MGLLSHGRSSTTLRKHSKNNEPFLSFSLTLVIRENDLDIDWLTTYLGINPTHTYIFSGLENEEKDNAWYYRLTADDKYQLDSVSNNFFDTIRDVGVKLVDLNNIEARIILHVHAELAQVYFEFPENMVDCLSKCRIPFSISIFDWGGIMKD